MDNARETLIRLLLDPCLTTVEAEREAAATVRVRTPRDEVSAGFPVRPRERCDVPATVG